MKKTGLITAISIVITNMIGTGILTTPGVLSSYLSDGRQILLVWLLAGGIALLGVIVYAQMGSLMPHSGGEFYYLSRIYHPCLGKIAGWISIIVGFAGPIALSALAFSEYVANFSFFQSIFQNTFISISMKKIIALLLIFSLSIFHIYKRKTVLRFQVIITVILIAFLLLISYLSLRFDNTMNAAVFKQSSQFGSNNLGMALLIAIYSYTGYNASCYFAGELYNPKSNLHLSLFIGVFIVMTLYLVVNYCLLRVLGVSGLSGQIDFLSILGYKLNGQTGSFLISATVIVILIASTNSMIYTGSNIPLLNSKVIKTKKGKLDKSNMYLLQLLIACLFVIFTEFQQLIIFLTLILTFFSILTALGVFLLPWKRIRVAPLQKIIVKTAAGLLLIVLVWLSVNSIVTISYNLLLKINKL